MKFWLFWLHVIARVAIIVTFTLVAAHLFTVRAAKAAESDWHHGVYAEAGSGYVLKDLGVSASTDPVLQAGAWVSYKGFTVDLWTSTELDNGVYGKRGGDEIDLTLSYTDTAETPIGEVNYTILAAYYAISFPSLGRMEDDVVELRAEVERPFKTSWGSVKPYVRLVELVGIDTMPDITIARPGLRLEVPLDEKFTLQVDGAQAFNLSGGEHVAHATIGLHYKIDETYSAKAEIEVTDNGTDPVVSIGFSASW